jgi:hypothetical protein
VFDGFFSPRRFPQCAYEHSYACSAHYHLPPHLRPPTTTTGHLQPPTATGSRFQSTTTTGTSFQTTTSTITSSFQTTTTTTNRSQTTITSSPTPISRPPPAAEPTATHQQRQHRGFALHTTNSHSHLPRSQTRDSRVTSTITPPSSLANVSQGWVYNHHHPTLLARKHEPRVGLLTTTTTPPSSLENASRGWRTWYHLTGMLCRYIVYSICKIDNFICFVSLPSRHRVHT